MKVVTNNKQYLIKWPMKTGFKLIQTKTNK